MAAIVGINTSFQKLRRIPTNQLNELYRDRADPKAQRSKDEVVNRTESQKTPDRQFKRSPLWWQ
ncbi:MAG: hypothetical protein SW833_11570 [Cyanobacteriota bacterium]|nr:hypothetical protein [Cyanobacteriota bacterium]